jgi:hypothetical protein
MHAAALALALALTDPRSCIDPYWPCPPEAVCGAAWRQANTDAALWQCQLQYVNDVAAVVGATAAECSTSVAAARRRAQVNYAAACHAAAFWWACWAASGKNTSQADRLDYLQRARVLMGDDAFWYSGRWWRR